MQMQEIVKGIKVYDGQVKVVSADTEAALKRSTYAIYSGQNTKTKKVDFFLAVLDADNEEIVIWRYSGKKGIWQEHNIIDTQSSDVEELIDDVDGYLYEYDCVENFKVVKKGEASYSDNQETYKPGPNVGSTNKSETRKETPMNDMKAMNFSLERIFGKFGKAAKGEFAMTLDGGKIAIKKPDGTYISWDGQEETLVNNEGLVMGIDAFYYMPTPVNQLQPGDVVITGKNSMGWVLEVNAEGTNVKIQGYGGHVQNFKPARHVIFPQPYVTKVVSLFQMGQNQPNFGGFNPMMLMCMGGGIDGDTKSLLLMSLMGAGQPINPMMLMMLAGKDGLGGGDTMQTLMLMSMMNGGGNLMGNLFGGGAAAPEAKKAKK